MPLHPDGPGAVQVLRRLDHAVLGHGGDAQLGGHDPHGLVVVRPDGEPPGAEDGGQPAPGLQGDLLLGAHRVPRRTAVSVAGAEIGDESSPAGQVEQLGPPSDRQQRGVAVEALHEEVHGVEIGAPVDPVPVRHGPARPVEGRVDVPSSEHQHRVRGGGDGGVGQLPGTGVDQDRPGTGVDQALQRGAGAAAHQVPGLRGEAREVQRHHGRHGGRFGTEAPQSYGSHLVRIQMNGLSVHAVISCSIMRSSLRAGWRAHAAPPGRSEGGVQARSVFGGTW